MRHGAHGAEKSRAWKGNGKMGASQSAGHSSFPSAQGLPAGEDVPIRARAEQPLPPPAASLGQQQDLSPTTSLRVLPLFDKYEVSPLSVAI